MPVRKTQLGEQVKADVAMVRAQAMTDDLIAFYLGKMADNIRSQPTADRAAIMREAARRLTKEIR